MFINVWILNFRLLDKNTYIYVHEIYIIHIFACYNIYFMHSKHFPFSGYAFVQHKYVLNLEQITQMLRRTEKNIA